MKNLLFLIAVLVLPTSIGQAQRVADDYYGQGVTSYFSGNCQHALSSLNSAIALSPNDARYYYFRGLAQRLNGNSYAGDSDFQMAASLEARVGNGRSTKVSRSLEKVQGCIRLHIEEIRRQARKARELERLNPPQVVPQTYGQPIYPSNDSQALPGSIIETVPANASQMQGVVVEPNQSQPQAQPDNSIEAAPSPNNEAQPAKESDPFGGEPAAEATPTEDKSDEASPFGNNAVESPAEGGSPFGSDAAETGPVPDADGSPFGNDDGGSPFGNDASSDSPVGETGDSGVVDDPFSDN